MPTLRLTQFDAGQGAYRIQIDLDGNAAPQSANCQFEFQISDQDREDLRWYLEDYLEYPVDPAPTIAANVERRMAEVGDQLFRAIFQSNDDARDLWATLRNDLAGTRVEVASEVDTANTLPWELIRDTKTGVPLALEAHEFVRSQRQTAKRPRLLGTGQGQIRVLLVICRPGGGMDVPFRSVASHLVRLSHDPRQVLKLDVLRPPRFDRLGEMLRTASQRGHPYHVVHFDGHGAYSDLAKRTKDGVERERSRRERYSLLSPLRKGKHGYLLFENPGDPQNRQFVDGPALGQLLFETGVPVLVLNACRSAHAEPPPRPDNASMHASDVHTWARAYGSLAQEVVDAGVPGVVAMRYNVWVVTAAQFIGNLYASLLDGQSLGEAVTLGRKQLRDHPIREIAFNPFPLQDWVVPVVYEAAPVRPFSKLSGEQVTITLDQRHAAEERAELDPTLPANPDVGFYGRDDTLLALDRAFDTNSVVLLHALAGSGKTTTAVEFARWYAATGGVRGQVLFTSFEHYLPLDHALDRLGQHFERLLQANEIHWLALSDEQRHQVALQILKQVTVLWIWDNVESVSGFPSGAPSAWTLNEQQKLIDFLRAASSTKAKFLLTSRRDEHDWLGDLPCRVELPPMPFTERVQLTRAIANKHGHHVTKPEDWKPLLDYTMGNPLTLTVLVRQALRDNLHRKGHIEALVQRLRADEVSLPDEEQQGRSRSLGASLGYGFQGFTDAERSQLALLHLFEAFVNVDVLCWMSKVDDDEALQGLDREAWIALLDRTAEIGLLTALGAGHYMVHPALPWYFSQLFAKVYGDEVSSDALQANHSFSRAIAHLGNYYHDQYEQGHQRLVTMLRAEEANLLRARRIGLAHGWWDEVIGSMQGLRALYNHSGRLVEWARLVGELVPHIIDPDTDQAVPGRDDQWNIVTQYRVELMTQGREWVMAERLLRLQVAWNRNRTSAFRNIPSKTLSDSQRRQFVNLSSSLSGLGELLREQSKTACVEVLTQALKVIWHIGDRKRESSIAYSLGSAYATVTELRDLAEAERWSLRSLELTDEADSLGRGRCLSQLGYIHWRRFNDARDSNQPTEKQLDHLNAALRAYLRAAELFPADAVVPLAVTHNQLGIIYAEGKQFNEALRHSQEAIRYHEATGNRYKAGHARSSVMASLILQGQFKEAILWGQAALRDFEHYGVRAADDITFIQQSIATIKGLIRDNS